MCRNPGFMGLYLYKCGDRDMFTNAKKILSQTSETVMAELRKNGDRGEYMLYFKAICTAGATYEISANFYIKDIG